MWSASWGVLFFAEFFQGQDLGHFPLRTLELSRLGAKDAKTGYWKSDFTVPVFPEVEPA